MITKIKKSRIAKRIIFFSSDVKITFLNNLLEMVGPLGSDSILVPKSIIVVVEDDKIYFNLEKSTARKELCGTYNALINNIVIGITKGFEKRLVIIGVGYKCSIADDIITFRLGFSHLIKLKIPNDIKIEIKKQTMILIKGINKYRVGWFSNKIRDLKPPEPYKGVGIRYENEQIIRKEGKTAGK